MNARARSRLRAASSAAALLASLAGVAGAQERFDVEDFETRIRPLLADNCYECHAVERQRSGLRLDTLSGMLAGGLRGPAIVPGEPDASLLVAAIEYADDALTMPPKRRLADDEIEAVRRWIAAGAPAPDEVPAAARDVEVFDLEARRASHWAYAPVADPSLPSIAAAHADRVREPLDRFVMARLEREGLELAPTAEPRTLIRRLSFALNGLPPTPEEIDAFLEECAAEDDGASDAATAEGGEGAYGRLVARLLASPRFGETWARHWLDLVRYSDTKGHEFDYPIPNAWEYRDYVIRAFDEDVPYDRFVVEHVAGDLLDAPRTSVTDGDDVVNESIIGTAFWFLGDEVHSPVDPRLDQCERIANQLDVFSKAFLAQTVACARCHDHKFDPIRQTDYYALAGFLLSSSYRQARFDAGASDAATADDVARRRKRNEALLRVGADPSHGLRARVAGFGERLLEAARASFVADASGVDASDSYGSPEANEPTGPNAGGAEAEGAPEDAAGGEPAPLAAALAAARTDATHPLHPFVLVADAERAAEADASPGTEPTSRADALAHLAELRDARREAEARLERVLASARVVFDPRATSASDWIQDGVAFVRVDAGDATSNWPPRPHLAPAAVTDAVWSGLRRASGEVEAGMKSWDSTGRMLRTPTIRLGSGKLYYLVRGAGHAFAQVDGHRLVQGPLHHATLRSWSDAPFPRWIEQDLSDYSGSLAHVEFAAGEDGELALMLAIEADEAPPDAPYLAAWLDALGGASATDASATESIARAYGEALDGALERIAASAPGATSASASREDLALVALFASLERDSFGADPDAGVERAHLAARTVPALLDGNGVDEALLVRGSHSSPASDVPRRFLEVLGGAEQAPIESGSGRLELARRLVDPASPLLARVHVNRVWKHLFGRGLVASVDDFGRMGDAPSHPELLDHLATRFVASGWSTKALIRMLVNSATYRASSLASPRARELDPDGVLLQSMRVRRLEGEAIRDAVLAVSGRLDETRYGPAVPVHLTEFLEGRGRPSESGPLDGAGRRSIYLSVRRNFPVPMLEVFDRPNPMTTAGRRAASNVPAQALALMNDPFVREQARAWAASMLAVETTDEARVDAMVERALGRPATAAERERLVAFVAEQARLRAGEDGARLEAWADVGHVLYNTKEFIYLP